MAYLERRQRSPPLLEGITEKLKAEDQMAWVRAINAISVAATEIVAEELINA